MNLDELNQFTQEMDNPVGALLSFLQNGGKLDTDRRIQAAEYALGKARKDLDYLLNRPKAEGDPQVKARLENEIAECKRQIEEIEAGIDEGKEILASKQREHMIAKAAHLRESALKE